MFPSQTKFPNLTNEVAMIRREIRSSLFMNDLTKVSQIISLSDFEIDPELADNIKYISKENYENYEMKFITLGECGAKIQNALILIAQCRIEHEEMEQKDKFY